MINGSYMSDKSKKLYHTINAPSDREQEYLTLSQANGNKNAGVLGIKEIIDKTTSILFRSYKTELLSEPITYIVSAIWGKSEHRDLTAAQKEIHLNISAIINDIIEMLEINEINDAQRFAIEYLIRGLVISKVTYLIEASKNRQKAGNESCDELMELLNSLEVAGNA
jgi:hypothetical protein